MVRVKNAPPEYWKLADQSSCPSPSSPSMFDYPIDSFDLDRGDNLLWRTSDFASDGYECPWDYSKDDTLGTVDYCIGDLKLDDCYAEPVVGNQSNQSMLPALFTAQSDTATPGTQHGDATPGAPDDDATPGAQDDDATPGAQDDDADPGAQDDDAAPEAQDDRTIPKLSDFGSEYEFQRACNIAKNKAMLQQLGLEQVRLPTFSKRPPGICKRPSARLKQSSLARPRRRNTRAVTKPIALTDDVSDDDASEVLPEYGSVCSSRAISPENVEAAVEQLSIEELIDTLDISPAQSMSDQSAFQNFKLKGLRNLQSKGVTKPPGCNSKKLKTSRQTSRGAEDPKPSMELKGMDAPEIERQLKLVDISLSTDDVQTSTPGMRDKVTYLSWMGNCKVQAKPVVRDNMNKPYNYYIGVFDTLEIATFANTLFFCALKSDSVIQNIKNAANDVKSDAIVKFVAKKVINALGRPGPGFRAM